MKKEELYGHYLPAIEEALKHDNSFEPFALKEPSFYLNVPEDKLIEIELYLDKIAGTDEFLDNVAYYFDAKSHGFTSINNISIDDFKKSIVNEMLKYKEMYHIE